MTVCTIAETVTNKYKRHVNKRLINVVKTVMTSSRVGCMRQCSLTDGCLAVNIIGHHDITCELTTGLGNEAEMQDDSSSQLFILGKVKVLTNSCKKMGS